LHHHLLMRGAVLLVGATAAIGAACAVAACGQSSTGDTAGFPDASADGASDAGVAGDTRLPSFQTDGSLLDAACATGTARALLSPIYLLVVLDGSGSMAEDGKWTSVVPALESLVDDLEERADPSYGMGLTVFSDTNDPTRGVGPYPTMDVPIAFVDANQAAAIHARLDSAQPMYQTPTLAVLTGQYSAMEAFTPPASLAPGGRKVVVFMTDGVPYPDDGGTQQDASIAAAAAEFAKTPPAGPITTLAVGIGYYFPYDPTDYDPVFMGELAIAGGSPNEPCNALNVSDPSMFCHLQVTPVGSNDDNGALEAEFVTALDEARGKVASCTLSLERPDGGQPLDPTHVNVVFVDDLGDQTVVPEGAMNGWTYDDPTTPTSVTLNGTACTTLHQNPDGYVTVVLGCETIVQ
jgi:hypothetical protein